MTLRTNPVYDLTKDDIDVAIKEYIQKRIKDELHTSDTKVKYILKDIADESATRGPYRPEYVVVGAEVIPSYLE